MDLTASPTRSYWILGWAVCLWVAVGCSQSDHDDSAFPEAPQELEPFLSWAAEKLQEEPDSAPLPAPQALEEVPRLWEAVHLLENVGTAELESSWARRDEEPATLAVIRNVSSESLEGNVRKRVARRITLEGEDAPVLVIRGFNVRRERVGALAIRARIPYGRHFVLQWSEAGRIAVPVPTHDEPVSLWIPTDGFAEWEGPLRRIRLVMDGHGDGEIRVDRLEFLARRAAYADPVGVKRTQKGEDLRSALYMHVDGSAEFPLQLPRSARLQLGLAVESAKEARLQVTVRHRGQSQVVFSQRIKSANQWADVRISLERWSGEDVTLSLRATGEDPDAVALWANPVVYQPVETPPIVVIYLIDTLSSEHIQAYGYHRETMPTLQEFAEGGVLFSDMVSNSSRTIESIPDLMSSLPTERHDIWHYLHRASSRMITLAEILRHAGFATVSFCTNVNAGPRQAMDQGFDRFIDKIGYWWTDVDRTVPLNDVSDWLDHHVDRPMFLYVHTAEPHAPYSPPAGFADRFDPHYEGHIDGTYDGGTGFRYTKDPRAVEHVIALYDEEVAYADHRFGRFLDLLNDAGVGNRAHVFVTSDHGEEFLQHANWEHGESLHNEQTRVPLAAVGPDFARGARVDVPVQIFDIMPTVLDLFSLRPPYDIAGRSLLPLLKDGNEASSESWTERTLYGSNHFGRMARPPSEQVVQYSAIHDGWKILYGFQNLNGEEDLLPRFALYNLVEDPLERNDVLSKNEKVARDLIEKLLTWRLRQKPFRRHGGPASLNLRETKALEALGYLNPGETER